MTQETRNDMLVELAGIVGDEEAQEYSGLPRKAVEAILSAKKAEAAAKAEAQAATEKASSTRGRKRKEKGPQPTQRAKALRRNLSSGRESKLTAACARLIEEPWLGNDEVARFVEANNDMPARLTGARNMLRALYQAGALSPEWHIYYHSIISEKETIEETK